MIIIIGGILGLVFLGYIVLLVIGLHLENKEIEREERCLYQQF